MHTISSRARSRAALAVASLAVAAAPAAARAQLGGVNPFSFGVSGGAAIPTGDAGDDLKTGYSVDGIVAVRVPTLPVSFRGEVGYTRFGVKNEPSSSNFRLISGVVNAVLTLLGGATTVVRPYLIGGVGVYNGRIGATDEGVSVSASTGTKFGINGGVGIEIPLSGITGFGEVRFTQVYTKDDNRDLALPYNTSYIPIRFGIRF